MSIFLSASASALASALSAHVRTVTVEAEYGATCVEGSMLTLAHHGCRSENRAPCVYDGMILEDVVFGISHVDLDTLGGIFAVQGRRPGSASFWNLAEYVDVHGSHRSHLFTACTETDRAALMAWHAWSTSNRAPFPKGDEVHEVDSYVEKCFDVLSRIFAGDTSLLLAGAEHDLAQATLASDSYMCALESDYGPIFVRSAEVFVNHLYRDIDPNGEIRVASAIVGFNKVTGAVTLSFEDGGAHFDACAIMQHHFGKEAGGRRGIAGTPRNVSYTLTDAIRLAEAISKYHPKGAPVSE